MAKYSEEFKLQLVKEYAEGKLGYIRLAHKYGLPDPSPIRRWVRTYQEFGIKALRRKQTKQVYSVQFKVDVLQFMEHTGASFQDTAIHFKMNNHSLIVNWNRLYLAKGVKGLEARAKGRTSMSKKQNQSRTKSPCLGKRNWNGRMSSFVWKWRI